jgi:hypothetical protein
MQLCKVVLLANGSCLPPMYHVLAEIDPFLINLGTKAVLESI